MAWHVRTIALGLPLLLTGCLTDTQPVASPTAFDVDQYVAQCPVASPLTPKGYAQAGFARVDQLCDAFFDGLVLLNRDADFSHSVFQLLTPSTLAALAVTSASAKAITATSAGIVLTDGIIEAFAKKYAYSPVLFQLRKAVKDALTNDRTVLVGNLSDQNNAPSGQYCMALYAVQRYASDCSIANIESFAATALLNATPTETDASRRNNPGTPQQRLQAASVPKLNRENTPFIHVPNYTIAPSPPSGSR